MTTRRKKRRWHVITRLWLLLQSRTLSIVLLLVVVLAVVLALVVPQAQVNPETYAAWKSANPFLSGLLDGLLLTRIYSSWWFYTAVALLLVNTFACTLSRILSLLRQGSQWPRLNETQIKRQIKNWATLETPHPAAEVTAVVQSNLLRQGYKITREDAEDKSFIFARKGELAQWGSILFHFSLVVVLVGMVLVQVTRYVGTMVITEGQTVTERREDYLRIDHTPLVEMEHQGFQVRLERFVPAYHQGTIGTDYVADLVFLEKGSESKMQRVRVNQPATYKGVRFLLGKYGFAPLFVLGDKGGRKQFESYVNLTMLPPGREDFFTIPETSLTVWASLYPDMVMVEGSPATRSLVPQNPVLYLEVTEDGREVFQGLLPLEDSVVFGEKSLTFADLRYWTQYQVIKDPGKEFVFGGLWLGIVGLVVRYLFNTKHVLAVIRELPQGTRLTLGGRSPQMDSLYSKEFDSLVTGLKKEISNDPN